MKPYELLRIKSNQIEMMMLRGYNIEETEKRILEMQPSEFSVYIKDLESPDTLGHPLNKLYKGKNLPDILVCYIKSEDGDVIKAASMAKYFKSLENIFPKDIIIVALDKVKAAKQLYREYLNYNITLFTSNELKINPTKHKFSEVVIRKLTEEEKLTEFKKKSAESYLELSYDDAVVKFYGFVPGDLILCRRRNLDPASMIEDYEVKKMVSTNSIYILDTNI